MLAGNHWPLAEIMATCARLGPTRMVVFPLIDWAISWQEWNNQIKVRLWQQWTEKNTLNQFVALQSRRLPLQICFANRVESIPYFCFSVVVKVYPMFLFRSYLWFSHSVIDSWNIIVRLTNQKMMHQIITTITAIVLLDKEKFFDIQLAWYLDDREWSRLSSVASAARHSRGNWVSSKQ